MPLVLAGAALAVDLLLAAFAARRPWSALIVLVALLPFNGLLVQVVAQIVGFDDIGRIALAAWHDAIVLGIVLAAAWTWLRTGPRRPSGIEMLVGLVSIVGVVYVVVSPVRLTAAYAFRTIYEPPVLLAALLMLGRLRGVPGWLPGRASQTMVISGVIAALAVWPQVYLGKVAYLQTYYAEPGLPVHHSFFATGIAQPRGIGTFTSPNEAGAYFAIAMALLVVPGLIRMPGWARTASLGALGLALLLTFSRSGWLTLGVAAVCLVLLNRELIARLGDARTWISSRRSWVHHAPATAATLGLLLAILITSGAPTLIKKTATGADPSAGNRPASIQRGVTVVKNNPLGLGLGTAGPKAGRFDESASNARILTEAWYIVYAIQVGIGGALLFGALVLAVLRRLWAVRRSPVAQAAIAVGVGLAVGALFIPIIDEPTVATPLWTIAALGIAGASIAPTRRWDGVGAD